ncbi:MAG: alpha-N-arabinofuranosidase [Clostridiales bacterium]|jgi:alpha-N-arabinofuranosidase|nr:alpha-N-arabinofuranosidase [Clostridiales bacterium]
MSKIVIDTTKKLNKISKNIYGHFSEHLGRCIYGGLYVGEASDIPNINGMRTDVVEALRAIKIPVLRWPGGCFADEYHWQDGIGEKTLRKKMINTHWGGVTEDNSFGTHEFFELCNQLGCEAYVNGNLGSGTVREMSEWVEYMTFSGISSMSALREANGNKEPWKVAYFGVGNENWACGGNMRPSYYADEYRRYQTYIRNYDKNNKIFKVACGSNGPDFDWTDIVMEIAGKYMDGISMHHYTVPRANWQNKGFATEFSEEDYYSTIEQCRRIEELIKGHLFLMDKHDKEKRVKLIVDEWGTWFDAEPGTTPGFLYQQNTMRDAMVASLTLDIFNKYSSRVEMANIAQTVNVLQSVILTENERMVKTPTYHVFDLYKEHMDAGLLDSYALGGKVSVTASEKNGEIFIAVTNYDYDSSDDIEISLTGLTPKGVSAQILTAGKATAHNTFDEPNMVTLADYNVTAAGEVIKVKMPACSVAGIKVK